MNVDELNSKLFEHFSENSDEYLARVSAALDQSEMEPAKPVVFDVFEPFGDGMRYPVYTFKVTDPFGVDRGSYHHRGEDLRTVNIFGTIDDLPVQSVEAGTVRIAEEGEGYGFYAVITHDNGFETLYAHNSKLLIAVGNRVERGQVIAVSGATGRVTGPHVHFAVRRKKTTGGYDWFPPSSFNWNCPLTVTINARSGLRVRTGPGLEFDTNALAEYGNSFSVLDDYGPIEEIDGIRANWIKIGIQDQVGWVFSGYVDYDRSCRSRCGAPGCKKPDFTGYSEERLRKFISRAGETVTGKEKREELVERANALVDSAFLELDASCSDEDICPEDWSDRPVENIRGIGTATGEILGEWLSARTIGELAGNSWFRTAMILSALREI